MNDIAQRRRQIERERRAAMDLACAEFDERLAALRVECGESGGHRWQLSSCEIGPAGYEFCVRCGAGRSDGGG